MKFFLLSGYYLVLIVFLDGSMLFAEESPGVPNEKEQSKWLIADFSADHWEELFVRYQKFLHEKPFALERHRRLRAEERAEKAKNHRRLSIVFDKFSTALERAARRGVETGELSAHAPSEMKKEKKNRLAGSWNFYKNIPPNAEDVWREACFLRFLSLRHLAPVDPEALKRLHQYVDSLEQYPALDELFQEVKRQACLCSLRQANDLLDELLPEDEGGQGDESSPVLPQPSDFLAPIESFADAVFRLAGFLAAHPTEENMRMVDPFLETLDRLRSQSPAMIREATLFDVTEPLRTALAKIRSHARHAPDPDSFLEYAELLEGTLRRQELLGKVMSIHGVDLDGNVFDQRLLEGKVVLLDFWATWCGPCVAEFPQLEILYAKYREKGFEIIGYSVDSDMGTLRRFLEKRPVPWIVLSKEATKAAGLPSLSAWYGAKKLPVVLLRGRDDKAILLDARGRKLENKLEEIFGE